jgi:hypothetical protein
MTYIGNLKKILIFLYNFFSIVRKPYNVAWSVLHETHIVLSAMKRGNETLDTLSLQFFSSVKCFIVTIFTRRLTLHLQYF